MYLCSLRCTISKSDELGSAVGSSLCVSEGDEAAAVELLILDPDGYLDDTTADVEAEAEAPIERSADGVEDGWATGVSAVDSAASASVSRSAAAGKAGRRARAPAVRVAASRKVRKKGGGRV